MSVEFDDQESQRSMLSARLEDTKTTSGMVSWLMKVTGMSASTVNVVFIIIIVFALGLGYYFFTSSSPVKNVPPAAKVK